MMPSRERRQAILSLALPIIGGMLSQNILNLVDTAMVGSLGDAALAAVGIGSFASFMASAFITGLSAGVQATAARRLGEGRDDEMAIPLNGGLVLATALAVPLSAVLIWRADALFPLIEDDPEVVALGVPYLQLRLVGMVAMGANFAFRGYWNGVQLSRLYMRTLVIMHACNIVLNWLLIFGNLGFPEMGVRGAALGTTLSTYIGTGVYIALALRHARAAGFARALPGVAVIRAMFRLAAPAGLQQFLFATGMTVLFGIIGAIGTAELAAANVLINLMLVAILPGMGYGMAAASLVGRALGQGEAEAAKGWGWDVSRLAMVSVGLIALPALVFPDPLLAVFIHDPDTLALARAPLRLSAATIALDTLGMVLLNALLGAGANRTVMLIAVGMQWGVGLPLIYLIGPVLGGGLLAIWCVQVAYRAAQAGVFALVWRRGRWTSITL